MKYKTFADAINDGWSLVPIDKEIEQIGTYYSYWKKDGKVLCEDELIENWTMNNSHQQLTIIAEKWKHIFTPNEPSGPMKPILIEGQQKKLI